MVEAETPLLKGISPLFSLWHTGGMETHHPCPLDVIVPPRKEDDEMVAAVFSLRLPERPRDPLLADTVDKLFSAYSIASPQHFRGPVAVAHLEELLCDFYQQKLRLLGAPWPGPGKDGKRHRHVARERALFALEAQHLPAWSAAFAWSTERDTWISCAGEASCVVEGIDDTLQQLLPQAPVGIRGPYRDNVTAQQRVYSKRVRGLLLKAGDAVVRFDPSEFFGQQEELPVHVR